MDSVLEGLIIGMKRALDACENCDGDLGFAIFVIKKDLEQLESEQSDQAKENAK